MATGIYGCFWEAITLLRMPDMGRMQNVRFEAIGYLPLPTLSGPSATV